MPWYNSVSKHAWNLFDYYCSSGQQAIDLYANKRGDFWNVPLHQQKEPPEYLTAYGMRLRGSDYHYISEALRTMPFETNYVTYHGVEPMELEFYEQLKPFATIQEDGWYDFSKAIGQTITSYGFISTSIIEDEALQYVDNWMGNSVAELALKVPTMFVIHVPKGYPAAHYLADFEWMGRVNIDNQILIDKDCKFKINNITKEKKMVGLNNDVESYVNIFDVDLVI